MATAKDIRVAPVAHDAANALVRRLHYSSTVVKGSQLHLGVFLGPRLEGVMQFGPPLDRRNLLPLVADTPWNGMLELNRMAFSEHLPRNSESRALAVAFRLIRKHYPGVKWIVSFADGTRCGDGTIYRAAGFLLTGISKNKTMWRLPDGTVAADLSIKMSPRIQERIFGRGRRLVGSDALREAKRLGAAPLPGFQLRYLFFLDPSWRAKLTVPVLPFSEIERLGASMYLGSKRAGLKRASGDQPKEGGADPTPALQPLTHPVEDPDPRAPGQGT